MEGAAPQLCEFLAALPLCDLSGARATLAHCGAAAAAACGLRAPQPPALVTRHEVSGPAGFAVRLVGVRGVFPQSGGRVLYGDATDTVLPYAAATVAAAARAVAAGGFAARRHAPAAAYVPGSEAAFEALGNKATFARFMAAHAASFGATAPRALAEPPRAADYPCLLKLAVSDGGIGVHVLRSAADYASAAAATAGEERVLQAWARGRVMGTAHYALLRGRPLAAAFFEAPRPRGLRIHKGGITGYARRAASPHAGTFEQLFAALNFTGLACVNYIVDAPRWPRSSISGSAGGAERLTIIEVNPRVGSSLRQAPDELRRLLLPALAALEAEALAGVVPAAEGAGDDGSDDDGG